MATTKKAAAGPKNAPPAAVDRPPGAGDPNGAPRPSAGSPAAPPPIPHTADLVFAALRQNQIEGGSDYARRQLIDALAGACRFSIELDGLAATLALLADAARVLEIGYGGGGARGPILH